jgi:hypothetical protein
VGGGEVNILEDARHSSVLYICKYFVVGPYPIKGHDIEMDFFHFLYNSDAHRTLPKKFDQSLDFILEFLVIFE